MENTKIENTKAHTGHIEHKPKFEFDLVKYLYWVIALLAIVLILNIFLGFNVFNEATTAIERIKEAEKPVLLQTVVLKNSNCASCFDVENTLKTIMSGNVNVTKEESFEIGAAEATDLINKYRITKLPTIIVTGQINKTSFVNFETVDDALVFVGQAPPYSDENGNIIGVVSYVLIENKKCENCTKLDQLVTQLKNQAVVFENEETIDFNEQKAKELIKKYNITILPSIILTKDASAYKFLVDAWQNAGTVEEDGSFVLRDAIKNSPPYFDLALNKIRGLIELTLIVDKTCDKCYNVSLHKTILGNLGVKFAAEKEIDVSQASALLKKYNITKIPTVVLDKEADVYASLQEVWSRVGVIADDGSYVFTNVETMLRFGGYRDLSAGEVVEQSS